MGLDSGPIRSQGLNDPTGMGPASEGIGPQSLANVTFRLQNE
jgi:hypothetical protein